MDYPEIDKFDEKTIRRIHLPIPIPNELYKELYSKGILKKEQLEVGKTYLGKCRNADKALWTGTVFIYKRLKFGFTFDEEINHLQDDEDGSDLFIPLKEI